MVDDANSEKGQRGCNQAVQNDMQNDRQNDIKSLNVRVENLEAMQGGLKMMMLVNMLFFGISIVVFTLCIINIQM